MEQFGKLGPVQAAAQFWSSLTSAQKLITGIFVASSVMLLVIVAVVATRPKMEVLFSGLQAEDAGAIVGKLQESKVEYEIDGGGTVIKVPSKNVHELRLQMATDGLPQGGTVGFELFDKTNLGMTEFAQKLQYQRALQGELTRTINQIDSVQTARIHLALPERDVFDREDKHPQASVVVKLRAGRELDENQIAGIVHLVASAVEGLKPNYVTVVDTRGNVLSEGTDGESPFDARLSASQIDLKATYEKQMQKNIESMLERVLGPNKAIVRVNTKMNFDQRETDSETYEPVKTTAQTGTAAETGKPVDGYKGVLLSEETTRENYGANSGQGAPPAGGIPGRIGGTAGVTPNTRPTGTTVSVEAGSGYTREESSNKYQVSKTTEHIVQTPGTVEKVSVAVMLDSKIDPGQVPSIQRVVEASAGIDPKRGDKVVVESVLFDDKAAKTEETEMEKVATSERNLSIGRTAGGVILLAGFLFFMKGLLRGIKLDAPRTAGQPAREPEFAPAMTYSPATVGVGAGTAAMAETSLPSTPVEVSQSPDEVAQVVREWISN